MDASGFRPWKHYWTGAGEEWASIDPDRISHCASGQSFCWKFDCSDDNGIRNYGNHAGCNGYQHALQSCYVLCNLWRRHVNDAGFWLVTSFLEIDEKTTLKSWTIMETLIGVTALIVSFIVSIFA